MDISENNNLRILISEIEHYIKFFNEQIQSQKPLVLISFSFT